MYKQRVYQILRCCVVITAAIASYFLIYYVLPYVYPFFLAVILSFVLNPVVTFLQNTLKMPRGLAVFSVLSMTISGIIGLIILFISELIHGTAYLADFIPAHFRSFVFLVEGVINEHLLPLYHNLASFFHTLSPEQQNSINESMHQFIRQFASFGTDMLNYLLLQVQQTLTILPGSITFFLFTILAAFFIMKDWNLLVESSKKMIPKTVLETGSRVWNHLQKAFSGYIKAQLLLMSITAATILTGLVVLQINHALTITLIATLADLLPFIGTGLIFIPWIVYLFLTADYSLTIGLAILYMIIVIQRQLLEPKLIANGIGLYPLVTLLALFIGIQIWGVLGVLIGPFLIIIGNALYQAGVFHQAWRFIKGA
ncbi:sporulation integral membrane protein YtvI [Lentibacillus salinarum]|uniref:Sporulation integral membrane protein YtvI n=1 Tax=Lentibacillus salinarum TaxID=446820 RepID=A0ABW3ZVI4_9BACI